MSESEWEDPTPLIPIVMREIIRLIEDGKLSTAIETAREFAKVSQPPATPQQDM